MASNVSPPMPVSSPWGPSRRRSLDVVCKAPSVSDPTDNFDAILTTDAITSRGGDSFTRLATDAGLSQYREYTVGGLLVKLSECYERESSYAARQRSRADELDGLINEWKRYENKNEVEREELHRKLARCEGKLQRALKRVKEGDETKLKNDELQHEIGVLKLEVRAAKLHRDQYRTLINEVVGQVDAARRAELSAAIQSGVGAPIGPAAALLADKAKDLPDSPPNNNVALRSVPPPDVDVSKPVGELPTSASAGTKPSSSKVSEGLVSKVTASTVSNELVADAPNAKSSVGNDGSSVTKATKSTVGPATRSKRRVRRISRDSSDEGSPAAAVDRSSDVEVVEPERLSKRRRFAR